MEVALKRLLKERQASASYLRVMAEREQVRVLQLKNLCPVIGSGDPSTSLMVTDRILCIYSVVKGVIFRALTQRWLVSLRCPLAALEASARDGDSWAPFA